MSDRRAPAHARVASTLFLAGAALLVVGNSAHPVDAEPTATSRLDLAEGASWVAVHLIVAVGVLLVVGALVSLRHLITHPVGTVYAGLGMAAAVTGGTMLAVVFGGLDGYAVASLATEWDTAAGASRATIESAAVALEAADSGITAVGIVAFFGLALAAFGRALVASRVVAPWLGWVALGLGGLGVLTGLAFAFAGPTSFTINALFRPLALAATAYFLALGVALRRLGPPPGTTEVGESRARATA